MRVVTTCHRDGFERYGHRLLDSWAHWPKDAELWWYTEGFSLPHRPPGVVEISADKLQGLQAFKHRLSRYWPPSYLYDVVRWSNKVYAACDALQDYQGIGVWLDADCVTLRDIPDGYIEGHLQRAFLALFKRRGLYSETGFWLMDCAHEQKGAFLAAWQDLYDSGGYRDLPTWTDSDALDATIRAFERAGLIRTVSLSGDHDRDMHPMAKVELGRYLDHCKGDRKAAGFSQENDHASRIHDVP